MPWSSFWNWKVIVELFPSLMAMVCSNIAVMRWTDMLSRATIGYCNTQCVDHSFVSLYYVGPERARRMQEERWSWVMWVNCPQPSNNRSESNYFIFPWDCSWVIPRDDPCIAASVTQRVKPYIIGRMFFDASFVEHGVHVVNHIRVPTL